jgi:zinc transport system substrate-binding protein
MTLSLSLGATLLASTALADVPKVAADIAPVHALVARVMDGVGTPELVIPAGASPHEYSLRPSEAAALQEADMVFWIGADLSPWLEDALETLTQDAEVTALMEAPGVTLLDFRENALFEAHSHDDHDHDHGEEHAHDDRDHDHGEEHAHDDHDHDHGEEHAHDDHDHDHGEEHAHDDHDHDHGEDHAHDDHDHGDDHAGHDHAHGAHDPHAWLSLANVVTWLDLIAARLSTADPDNAGAYFANAAAAKAEMDALEAEVTEILAPAQGGSFIVFHDAYQYFEQTFDFPAAGAISISDAREPSPARIAEVQGRIRDEGIDCVLAEPQFNPGLVATVTDGVAVETAVIDPLGAELAPGPDFYPALIRGMATTLAGCLTAEG